MAVICLHCKYFYGQSMTAESGTECHRPLGNISLVTGLPILSRRSCVLERYGSHQVTQDLCGYDGKHFVAAVTDRVR